MAQQILDAVLQVMVEDGQPAHEPCVMEPARRQLKDDL